MKTLRQWLLAPGLLLTTTMLWADSLEQQITADLPYLQDLYTHLHQHPELSFQEQQTAARISKELADAGYQVTSQVGGHGVVGVLKNGQGPVLMVRTDLDALPVKEQTGLPYASTFEMKDLQGKLTPTMHACGHDIHMSVFTGTARLLANNRSDWQGTLVMIGQPAEERGGGAKAMLADGLYERFPRPDYALALHVSADQPAGTVGAVSGYAMANVDSVDITVFGEGGHGAAPHTTKDPIVMASQLVMALQTIVSRELPPLDPAVVTVGAFNSGSKHNIISNSAHLQLTVRSYSESSRQQILAAIERIAHGIGVTAGMPEDRLPQVVVQDEFTPSVYNDPALTEKVLALFGQELGADNLFAVSPEMIGEDFSRYRASSPEIPSLMFRLGTVSERKFNLYQQGKISLPGLHSASYAPAPAPSIATGVEAMSRAAIMLLAKE